MSADSTKVLAYLYFKNHGIQSKIGEDLAKREVPTEEEMNKIIEAGQKDLSGAGFDKWVSINDKEFPAWIIDNMATNPVYIFPYSGELIPIFYTEDTYVLVENPSYGPLFDKRNLKWMSYDVNDETLYVSGEAEDDPVNKYKLSHEIFIPLLKTKVDVALATEGDLWFTQLVNMCTIPIKCAIPGNSGCKCNQLIRSHEYTLCDKVAQLEAVECTSDPKTGKLIRMLGE